MRRVVFFLCVVALAAGQSWFPSSWWRRNPQPLPPRMTSEERREAEIIQQQQGGVSGFKPVVGMHESIAQTRLAGGEVDIRMDYSGSNPISAFFREKVQHPDKIQAVAEQVREMEVRDTDEWSRNRGAPVDRLGFIRDAWFNSRLGSAVHAYTQRVKDFVIAALRFNDRDAGWASAVALAKALGSNGQTIVSTFKRFHHLALGHSFRYSMPDNVHIGVIGDWGTGNLQSLTMMKQMVQVLNVDRFIHLGDVYYSGTQEEFEKYFVRPLVETFNVGAVNQLKDRVWNLPGNHDYYTGGAAFFNVAQRIGSHPGSYWSQENSAWCIIGLDTSVYDSDPMATARGGVEILLPPEEAAWFKQRIDTCKEARKGVVVMSHHMLFSGHVGSLSGDAKCKPGRPCHPQSYVNDALYNQIGRSYVEKIDLWFWGHEHAWTRWAPYKGLKRGYLLGNGGVPEYPRNKIYDIAVVPGQTPPRALSQPASKYVVGLNIGKQLEVFSNGLYDLKFNGPNLEVTYYELKQRGTTLEKDRIEFNLSPVACEKQRFANYGGVVDEISRDPRCPF